MADEQAEQANIIDSGQVALTAKGRRERRMAAAMERRKQALALRMSGATYDAIAKQLGYSSRNGAWKAVKSALTDIPREQANELRALENARLDRMLMGVWEAARNGDTDAIDRALKIMQRRAKMMGIDAPSKHDVTWRDEARAEGYDVDQLWIELVTAARARMVQQGMAGGASGGGEVAPARERADGGEGAAGA